MKKAALLLCTLLLGLSSMAGVFVLSLIFR